MRATSIAEVLALYDELGAQHYDEAVSQMDHALQTAAHAMAEAAPDHLIAAALLHDVGHLLHLRDGSPELETGDLHHEATGAAWLGALFPPSVTAPIALHVTAKRYLCAVDADYASRLSAGSVRSLERQGGPLAGDEVASFEGRPGHVDAARLRRWDDAGKVVGAEVRPLRGYLPLLTSLT